jgi:hypothetical protein
MYRSYNFILLIAIGLGISGIVGLNWLVDPFDLYGQAKISGINTVKRAQYYERIFRPLRVVQAEPRSVVLGSSRTAAFTEDSVGGRLEGPFYNMSVSSLRVREAAIYLGFLLDNTDVQRVVLGVDFFSFNANRTSEPGFQAEILDRSSTIHLLTHSLMSLTAARETITSIRLSQKDQGSASAASSAPPDVLTGFKIQLTQYLKERKFYRGYVLDMQGLEQLGDVAARYAKRGRSLEILIPPSHALDTEAIRASGLWETFETWKRKLAVISDRTSVPIWDFSGYNAITTEPVRSDMRYFSDSSHFMPILAPAILDCMAGFNRCPANFGKKLQSSTVEAQLEEVRRSGDAYRKHDLAAMSLLKIYAAQVGIDIE